MEKKQKIVMKKLWFVIIIPLSSNCRGVIIRRKYNSPRSALSVGIVQWGIILGGKCPRGNCSRWNFLGAVVRGAIALGGNCPGDTFPGGNCQGGNYQVSLLLPMKLFNIKEGKTSLHIRSLSSMTLPLEFLCICSLE